TFDPKKKLSEREVSSLDLLLKKYESIKGSLRPKHARATLDIKTCSPNLTFQADVHYQLLNVNSEQLEIAREVADRVERTHELQRSANLEAAGANTMSCRSTSRDSVPHYWATSRMSTTSAPLWGRMVSIAGRGPTQTAAVS